MSMQSLLLLQGAAFTTKDAATESAAEPAAAFAAAAHAAASVAASGEVPGRARLRRERRRVLEGIRFGIFGSRCERLRRASRVA